MTCIVGFEAGEGVYIGGDCLRSDSSIKYYSKDSKVFELGKFLIGTAGSCRVQDVLRYGLKGEFEIGPQQPEQEDKEFLVNEVVPKIQKALDKNGVLRMIDNMSDLDGSIIIGYRGRLYAIFSDFQVFECRDKYIAIGSGSELALGALYALVSSQVDIPPAEIVKTALDAAAYADPFVSPPYDIYFQPRE